MEIIIFASIAILVMILIIAYKGRLNRQRSDSALRQRAVFNSDEQMTFVRLKEILPEANILAHVSFDALLTTKFSHTRRKYEKMFADFVVMDKECNVISIVAVGEVTSLKKMRITKYQDALLLAAGYKVKRYSEVPEYSQLREDFQFDLEAQKPRMRLRGGGLGKSEITQSDQYDLSRVNMIYDA